MAFEVVGRRAWGARAPKRELTHIDRTLGVKIHYKAGYVDPVIIGNHSKCYSMVRSIQNYHMDKTDDPYSDIGYTGIVCAHGALFIGRGPHKVVAANGPGLNRDHYALCALLGQKGLIAPTDAMIEGLREGIAWLRRDGNAGHQIKGHRDGYDTSCPGDPLYRLVRNGTLEPRKDRPDMEPATRVEIAKDFDDQFSRGNYPAGYLWQGSVAETRRVKETVKRIEEKQNALERQVNALGETMDSVVEGVERLVSLIDVSRPRISPDENASPVRRAADTAADWNRPAT